MYPDVNIMHVRLEVYKDPQIVVHYGGHARTSIDPHLEARLHEHVEYLWLMNPLHVIGSLE